MGTWMQRVAQDWMVLELGGSPLELSIVIGLQSVPSWLIGLWGGLLTDRFNVRTVLLSTQVAFAALSIALGSVAIAGGTTLWVLYAFAFAFGCANVFDKPARQAFVLEMVEPQHAANAISLNSSINNVSRLVGPALAGVLIGFTSTGVAFLVNAATFGAIILALSRIKVSALHRQERAPRGRGQIVEGLRHCWSNPILRPALLATLIISTLAQNFRILLPLYVVNEFRGVVSDYGLLMSALGLGALGGALVCAHISRPTQHMAMLQALWFGMALVTAALVPSYLALAGVMVGVGIGHTTFNTTSQTLLLLEADPDKRGRVMAVRQLLADGLTPLGSLLMGWISSVASPRAGMAVGGFAAFAGAYVLFRERTQVKSAEM